MIVSGKYEPTGKRDPGSIHDSSWLLRVSTIQNMVIELVQDRAGLGVQGWRIDGATAVQLSVVGWLVGT